MVESDLPFILFEVANQDLRAAKILYSNECYPQAVFYLEQAVEKATKAWALRRGIIAESELKRKGGKGVGHYTWEVYGKLAKLVDDKVIEKILENIHKMNNEHEHKISKEFSPLLNIILNQELDIDQLRELGFNDDSLESWLYFAGFLLEFNTNVKLVIQEEASTCPLEVKSHVEFLVNSHPELANKLLDLVSYMTSNLILLVLSLLLTPHVAISRYPEGEYGPQSYTKNAPIIQKFPDLVELVKGSFELLEGFFEEEEVR